MTEQSPEISSPQMQGIDVSHIQQTIDWNAVQQAGKIFAFIKATEGITYTDPEFAANWSGAKAANLLRGAYHFYETNDDPTAQAENFLSAVQLEPGDLPPVVDIERTKSGESASQIVQDLQTWLDAVEQATGRVPIIYTSPGYWNSLGTSAFGRYPLWVAEYGVQSPKPVAGWASWTFWQDSESGTVNGISGSVDLDVFYGALAELAALTCSPSPGRV
jgi:lysozyme